MTSRPRVRLPYVADNTGFFFDLATLCDQLGIALPAVREALRLFRAAGIPDALTA